MLLKASDKLTGKNFSPLSLAENRPPTKELELSVPRHLFH